MYNNYAEAHEHNRNVYTLNTEFKLLPKHYLHEMLRACHFIYFTLHVRTTTTAYRQPAPAVTEHQTEYDLMNSWD